MFIYVLGYIYVFLYADKIQVVVKSIPFKYALLQSVIVTVIGIYVFRLNIFAIPLLAYPLGVIVAASLFRVY